MGIKIKGISNVGSDRTHCYVFWCPGCDKPHPYRVAREGGEGPNVPVWGFNGSLESPTFTPSLLVFPTPVEPDGFQYQKRCHLFLTDGQISYCSDSEHALAGKTVPCPDWEDHRW